MFEDDCPYTSEEQLEAVIEEGQGLLRGVLYTVPEMWEIVVSASVEERDDPFSQAGRLALMFGSLAECAVVREPGDRPRCLHCDDEFHRHRLPAAICAVEASVPCPRAWMVLGICGGCYTGSIAQHMAAFCEQVRDTFGQELEIVPTYHQAGHA